MSRVGARLTAARQIHTNSAHSDLFTPTPDHGDMRAAVRQWVEAEVAPQALQFNREEKFNRELFRQAGDMGLLGVTVGEDYGGSGMDPTAAVIIHEELSAADPAFCLSYLAHSMLFTNNLHVNGSEEQKHRFLPAACSGEAVCGMAMTEPACGTDVLAMRTRAVKDEGDGSFVLNGSKMWITNGAVNDTDTGDVFLVYARTGEGSGAGKHSLFLVEKGMPGFTLGQKIQDKCGMRASPTAEIVFEDVRVPAENVVGVEGSAVGSMMRNLEIERVTLAAMSLGIARRSIEIINTYARERTAFGSELVAFGQIQADLADSYADYQAGRAYTYNFSNNMSLSESGSRIDSDGVKLFCARMAKTVADRAMQTLGGYGYVGEYEVERLWRDSKLLEIGGGTNGAHQKNMTKDLAGIERLP